MSRVSHAARLERLKRQLRGQPEVRVTFQPWVKELAEQYRRTRASGGGNAEVPGPAPRTAKEPER